MRSGGALLAPPEGSGAGPLLKSNLVHFRFKIWHLVATIIIIFLRINWPNLNFVPPTAIFLSPSLPRGFPRRILHRWGCLWTPLIVIVIAEMWYSCNLLVIVCNVIDWCLLCSLFRPTRSWTRTSRSRAFRRRSVRCPGGRTTATGIRWSRTSRDDYCRSLRRRCRRDGSTPRSLRNWWTRGTPWRRRRPKKWCSSWKTCEWTDNENLWMDSRTKTCEWTRWLTDVLTLMNVLTLTVNILPQTTTLNTTTGTTLSTTTTTAATATTTTTTTTTTQKTGLYHDGHNCDGHKPWRLQRIIWQPQQWKREKLTAYF